jgi:hypothetical protein
MAIQFGATFAGVFASFLLWFGARWLIQCHTDKNAAKQLLKDIEYEILGNIAILEAIINSTTSLLKDMKNMPSFVPRLRLDVYKYGVGSGDLHLLKNVKTQRLIKYIASECGFFNRYADGTDLWLGIYTLRNDPNSLIGAIRRLQGLIDNAKDTQERLVHSLNDLKKEHPSILVRIGDATQSQQI